MLLYDIAQALYLTEHVYYTCNDMKIYWLKLDGDTIAKAAQFEKNKKSYLVHHKNFKDLAQRCRDQEPALLLPEDVHEVDSDNDTSSDDGRD